MIYTIEKIGDFYIVKHLGVITNIKKKTLLQATKALAKFEKGRN